MKYRIFCNENVSALGFGAMRLPTLADGKPDEAEAIRMIRYAIDNGVNYVDTAYTYHDGLSEVIVGKALADGYREKVFVATKFPTWLGDAEKLDPDAIFNEQADRLGVRKIDVYMLHTLGKLHWQYAMKHNLVEWIAEKKKQGRIGYAGFSFHDDPETFRMIVDSHDWDFCQIQYNYVNETVQAGTGGLKYAAQKGLSVIVMEPLFGGALADANSPMGQIAVAEGMNPVDLALRWLWDKPEVSVVLSGMSTMSQTEQNVAVADRSGVGTLTETEREVVGGMRQVYDEATPIKCTKCRYCLPCPADVDIPYCFEIFNGAESPAGNRMLYEALYPMISLNRRADCCSQCGECETNCPQQLPIRDLLKKVADRFAPKSES